MASNDKTCPRRVGLGSIAIWRFFCGVLGSVRADARSGNLTVFFGDVAPAKAKLDFFGEPKGVANPAAFLGEAGILSKVTLEDDEAAANFGFLLGVSGAGPGKSSTSRIRFFCGEPLVGGSRRGCLVGDLRGETMVVIDLAGPPRRTRLSSSAMVNGIVVLRLSR